jgi:hypothetical protein
MKMSGERRRVEFKAMRAMEWWRRGPWRGGDVGDEEEAGDEGEEAVRRKKSERCRNPTDTRG